MRPRFLKLLVATLAVVAVGCGRNTPLAPDTTMGTGQQKTPPSAPRRALSDSALHSLHRPDGRSVSAAPVTRETYRSNGRTAVAEWSWREADVDHYTFILAENASQGPLVAVQTCASYSDNSRSCWVGVAFPTSSTLTIDKKMNAATLSPTMVELWKDDGSASMTVPVQASWTATGNAFHSNSNLKSRFDGIKEIFHDRDLIRPASAIGSINGVAQNGPLVALMVSYRSADFVWTHASSSFTRQGRR